MVDDLIMALKTVSEQLLPILGAVVLICLILFLVKCIKFIVECTKRVQQLETTVRGVDQSIEKMQAPLDTVVKVSHTVDKVHDKTEAAVKQAASFVSANLENLKEYIKPERQEESQEKAENSCFMTEGESSNV